MWITTVPSMSFASARAERRSSIVRARSTRAPSDWAFVARSSGRYAPGVSSPSRPSEPWLRTRYCVPKPCAPTERERPPIDEKPWLSTSTIVSFSCSCTAVAIIGERFERRARIGGDRNAALARVELGDVDRDELADGERGVRRRREVGPARADADHKVGLVRCPVRGERSRRADGAE